jgi:hypothetical protein
MPSDFTKMIVDTTGTIGAPSSGQIGSGPSSSEGVAAVALER